MAENQNPIEEIRSRCKAATPGPWEWAEKRWNDQMAPVGKSGKRRAVRGRSIKECYVYRLQGPPACPNPIDRFDYKVIMELNWYSVKGNALLGATPRPSDREFISHARQDMEILLDRIESLELEINDLKQRREGDAE